MNPTDSLHRVPAYESSQDPLAGTPFFMQRWAFKKLRAAHPNVPGPVICAEYKAAYLFVRTWMPKGPINREIRKIVSAALKRGVSAVVVAKEVLGLLAPQGTA